MAHCSKTFGTTTSELVIFEESRTLNSCPTNSPRLQQQPGTAVSQSLQPMLLLQIRLRTIGEEHCHVLGQTRPAMCFKIRAGTWFWLPIKTGLFHAPHSEPLLAAAQGLPVGGQSRLELPSPKERVAALPPRLSALLPAGHTRLHTEVVGAVHPHPAVAVAENLPWLSPNAN